MAQSTAFALLIVLASVVSAQQCLSSAKSDSYPANPENTTVPFFPAAEYISPGCSEVVTVPDQGEYILSDWKWERLNCPHEVPGLTPFSTAHPGLTAGSSVSVTGNVLLRQCDLPQGGAILNRITVKNGGSLVFDDSDIELNVREIYVEATGSIKAGSSTCRLYSNIRITFHGTAADSSPTLTFTGLTTKGMAVEGLAEFHGKQFHPTWTRLARTAQAGTRDIFLQHAVNWEIGQDVLITTTTYFDCPSKYQNTWCQNRAHQNEIRRIAAIVLDTVTPRYMIRLNATLSYKHYAGREYQGEVALLSRRIIFAGSNSNDGFGGHTMIMNPTSEGRFSGVQALNMGQLNIVGRYPFHFHMMGDNERTARSFMQDCAVVNSFFRCFVIHGTNATRLSRNVGYNADGFCFYLEDGVEERNLLEYNLAAHVHPIKRPANGNGGQDGETITQAADLFLPADISASGYYIPNAMNSFIGNTASGGWSGFAFPNVPGRLGNFKDTLPSSSLWQPEHRPLLKFYGNTAHSSGFYWSAHGSCVYVGAWLDFDGTTPRYKSGRADRSTLWPNNTEVQMVFEDTKAFLCNKGISHWGNTVTIRNYEAHDIKTSAMLFGNAGMDNALITGRTPNHPTGSNQPLDNSKMGFQFYDTWVKTILTNCTFRNFSRSYGTGSKDYAVRYMDHSDHYTPQGINSVNWIRWEDVPVDARLGIQNCGANCGGGHITMSSKIYSVWDWDGSFTQTGKPTVMGGNLGWWDWDNSCSYNTALKIYTCDWNPRKTVGFMELKTPVLYAGADYAKWPNCNSASRPDCVDDQYAPNTVGYVMQWGRNGNANYALDLGPWAGVSGYTNTGWHWRVKATDYDVDGPPSEFTIGHTFQLPKGHFVVISMAYPAGASFEVRLYNVWGSTTYPLIPMSTKEVVLSPREDVKPASQFTCTSGDWCTNHGGIGPAWHFDGTHLFVRVVNPSCYYRWNLRYECETDAAFENHNTKVWRIFQGFEYRIKVTACNGQGCTPCAGSPIGGVTYYNHPDSGGPAAFPNPDWGVAQPVQLPQPKPSFDFKCPAARGQGPVGGGGDGDGTDWAIIGPIIAGVIVLTIAGGVLIYKYKKRGASTTKSTKSTPSSTSSYSNGTGNTHSYNNTSSSKGISIRESSPPPPSLEMSQANSYSARSASPPGSPKLPPKPPMRPKPPSRI